MTPSTNNNTCDSKTVYPLKTIKNMAITRVHLIRLISRSGVYLDLFISARFS